MLKLYLKYTSSLHKNADLTSQNAPQIYVFGRTNIDLKYTSSSLIQ